MYAGELVGCGVKGPTSNLLVANCDEFIFYDDLAKAKAAVKPRSPATKRKQGVKGDVFEKLPEIVRSLQGDYDPVWGSIVKQTLKRVDPGFNEANYGFRLFSELLEAAADQGIIKLDYDESRGNYKVRVASNA